MEQALGPGRRMATPGTDLPLLHEDPHPSKTAGDVLSQEPSWPLPVQLLFDFSVSHDQGRWRF